MTQKNHNSESQVSQTDNLEATLEGRYQFDLQRTLARANHLVKTHFSAMVQACVVVFLVLVVIALIMQSLPAEQQGFIQIGAILVLAPLQTGLYMMGVRGARNESVKVMDVFSYLPITIVVALTQLIVAILTQLGLVLLIVPGIYIMVASTFALTLVADRNLSAVNAILMSCRIVNRYFWHMLMFTGVFLVLMGIGIATFGFALLWVMPLYFFAIGVLYADMVGTSGAQSSSAGEQHESTFDA
ncbi:stress protein [Alteromonas sp. ASW11-19]|uniref:Stress protein n=1 Tax=Alteromonas salexigens TaxID=2982530 RepID=A0ABT2VPE6_9ALTE|nr:stress protein [Alteromonas salexigens]MCU7554111.1 stress protein [Alteromonas salexigens]